MKAIVETISKVVSVEFLKSLTEHEVKVLFFSVWNIAFEAKEMQLFDECRSLLSDLHETLRRYGQYLTSSSPASKEFDISVLS